MNTQGMIPAKENANKKISDRYQKKTYVKGATCIYGDTLYRAKADITTAEEWTAAHWEETNMETIRAEMAAEVSSLNAKILPNVFVTGETSVVLHNIEKYDALIIYGTLGGAGTTIFGLMVDSNAISLYNICGTNIDSKITAKYDTSSKDLTLSFRYYSSFRVLYYR